jgi:hypothetical protein
MKRFCFIFVLGVGSLVLLGRAVYYYEFPDATPKQ